MNLEELVQISIDKANTGITKLPHSVFQLPGMSGKKGRILLNNVCEKDNLNYLEVGTYLGSTLISAMYDNDGQFTSVDNFSQFNGTLEQLQNNLRNFNLLDKVSLLTRDCWEPLALESVNVYFYDGPHGYDDQYKAISHYYDNLANKFILIVDDFANSSSFVEEATRKAIFDLNLKIRFEQKLGSDIQSDANGWWCGMYVSVLEK